MVFTYPNFELSSKTKGNALTVRLLKTEREKSYSTPIYNDINILIL